MALSSRPAKDIAGNRGFAAVLHHGGAGTTLTALACCIAQPVWPSGADRHINPGVHRRGAGLRAEPAKLTSHLLRRLAVDPHT